MKTKINIIISILIFLISVIAFDCIFGFSIGGKSGWLHFLLSVLFGVIISFLLTLLIYTKKQIKNEKFRVLLIISTMLFVILAKISYNPLNIIAAGDNCVSYDAQIVEIKALPTVFIIDKCFVITVKDINNNLINVNSYSPVITYDDGQMVKIKETKGGFGYSQYKITE